MTDSSSSSSAAPAPAAAVATSLPAAAATKAVIPDLIITKDNFSSTIPEIELGNKMQMIKKNKLKYLNAGRKGAVRSAAVWWQWTVDSRLGVRDSTMDEDGGKDDSGKEKKSGGKKRKSDKKKAASDDEDDEEGGEKKATAPAPAAGEKKRTYALGFGVDDNQYQPVLDAFHEQLVKQAQRPDVRAEMWKAKKGKPEETDAEIAKACKIMEKISEDEKKAAEYGAAVNIQILDDDAENTCTFEKKVGSEVDADGDVVNITEPVKLADILTKPGRFTFNAKLVRIVAKEGKLSYKWKIAYLLWEPPVRKAAPALLGMKTKRAETSKPAAGTSTAACTTTGSTSTPAVATGVAPVTPVVGAGAGAGSSSGLSASAPIVAVSAPAAVVDTATPMDVVKTPVPVAESKQSAVPEPVVHVSVTSNNDAPLTDESAKPRKSGKKRARDSTSPHVEGESGSKRQRTAAATAVGDD
jgi:hypothetical protein